MYFMSDMYIIRRVKMSLSFYALNLRDLSWKHAFHMEENIKYRCKLIGFSISGYCRSLPQNDIKIVAQNGLVDDDQKAQASLKRLRKHYELDTQEEDNVNFFKFLLQIFYFLAVSFFI